MKTRPWIDVSELSNPAHPDAQSAIDAATLVLFDLSAQKYQGIWTVTEQYICETTGSPVGCYWDPGERAYWNPSLGAYMYIRDPIRERARIVEGEYIPLRRTPVRQIMSVSIGGSAIPSANYELLNNRIVAPVDYKWSLCDGITVQYEYGVQPPALGKIACKKLAEQLLLAIDGNITGCELPQGVTSVSRQGINFEIFDPQEFLDKGRVGIYEVDLFLSTVNPAKAKKRPRVFVPGSLRPYRRS